MISIGESILMMVEIKSKNFHADRQWSQTFPYPVTIVVFSAFRHMQSPCSSNWIIRNPVIPVCSQFRTISHFDVKSEFWYVWLTAWIGIILRRYFHRQVTCKHVHLFIQLRCLDIAYFVLMGRCPFHSLTHSQFNCIHLYKSRCCLFWLTLIVLILFLRR